jgi:hypothetical protein
VTPHVYSETTQANVRALGAPVLDIDKRKKHNPSEWYAGFVSAPHTHIRENGKYSSAKEVVGTILGTSFHTAGLSRQQQSHVLTSLNQLHNDGLVDLKGNVPTQPRTLHKRKASHDGKVVSKVLPIKERFDASGFLQGQKSVLLQRFNPLQLIQVLLMSESIPFRARYYGDGELTFFSDGSPAIGGPVWCNEAYRETCARFPKIPVNRRVIMVAFGADKTVASSHITHPFFIKVLNVAEEFAAEATTLLALMPVEKKRKPKGGKAEGMSPEQLTLQTQLIVDAYATCLKELEEANRSGGVLLTFPDGEYVCFFACLSINEDLAGKKEVASTNFFHCTVCFTNPRN